MDKRAPRASNPGGLFLIAGVLGLVGLLAGCASTEPAPHELTNTQAQPVANDVGHRSYYATPSAHRRTSSVSTSGNFAPPAEWRTVTRKVTVNTPPPAAAPVAAAPTPAPAPAAAPAPVTRPVAAAAPSTAPSVAELAKMPLDTRGPKSDAEWKGPLPTPDVARIQSLKAEESRIADRLADLNAQRRAAIKAGGSTDTMKGPIERTLEQRRSAVALLVALEGFRDNPSRSAQIRYAKTLQRYNKAR